MAECQDCGGEFSITNPARNCAYCGGVFCSECLRPPAEGRRGELLCRACARLLAARDDGTGREAVYTRIDDLKTRKDAVVSSGVTSCSNPSCGAALRFREAKICSICGRGFCGKCISFPGEFRRTDVICLLCRARIEREVEVFDAGRQEEVEVLKDMGAVESRRPRSPEATLFFLKWAAHSRGANAIAGVVTEDSKDGKMTTGSASAIVVEKRN